MGISFYISVSAVRDRSSWKEFLFFLVLLFRVGERRVIWHLNLFQIHEQLSLPIHPGSKRRSRRRESYEAEIGKLVRTGKNDLA